MRAEGEQIFEKTLSRIFSFSARGKKGNFNNARANTLVESYAKRTQHRSKNGMVSLLHPPPPRRRLIGEYVSPYASPTTFVSSCYWSSLLSRREHCAQQPADVNITQGVRNRACMYIHSD